MNTNNESPAALLPCPFCGSEDVFCERADFSSAYILCNNCLMRGPEALQESDDEETPGEASAREAWNSRASTAPAASESRGSVPEGWMPIETLAKDHKARFILRRETPFIGYWDAKEGVWKDDGGLLRDPTEWLPTSRIRTAAHTPPAVASGEPTAELPSRFFYEAALEIAHKHASMSRDEFHKACEQRARELAEQARAGKEGG